MRKKKISEKVVIKRIERNNMKFLGKIKNKGRKRTRNKRKEIYRCQKKTEKKNESKQALLKEKKEICSQKKEQDKQRKRTSCNRRKKSALVRKKTKKKKKKRIQVQQIDEKNLQYLWEKTERERRREFDEANFLNEKTN